MKHGKTPRELQYILDEARPELQEVDSSLFPNKEKGQDGKPCPHIEYCLVQEMRKDCKGFKTCQTFKFYERYGRDYDELFI